METLIPYAIFGSGIIFALAVLLLFIAFIVSDIQEEGWAATVAAIVFIGLNYFWGNAPVMQLFTFKNIMIYVFIGFIFSMLRTVAKGKELKDSDKKKYFELKEHVYRWWFLWPICAINWVFGRLLVDVYNFVYSKISKVYEYLFNLKY